MKRKYARKPRQLTFEAAIDGPFKEYMSDFNPVSWGPFLRALDGLPPLANQRELFLQCTGRETPFTTPPRQAQAACGRKSGKTRIAALCAAASACFWDHAAYLGRGERAKILLLSQTRDQAQVARGYILETLESNPVTKALIKTIKSDVIVLENNVDIVVQAASYRSVRGFTAPMVICDEVALWRDAELSVNPAKEIIRALLPCQALVPQPLLLSISSPFAREGQFYEFYAKHHGDNDSDLLSWQASSLTMNPVLKQSVVDDAYATDPEAAAAEYGALFRSDIASFIDRDLLVDLVEPGRSQRGCVTGTRYTAFVDSSGGSRDSFALAIAHMEGDVAVLDVVEEIKAPFDPSVATAELCKVLKAYGCSQVYGDRYAGNWVPNEFKKHGITYLPSGRDRSQLYLEALPLLHSHRVRLLDLPRLISQLCSLQRRASSSGKQSVDHPKNSRDDVANACMGSVVFAADATVTAVMGHGGGAIFSGDGSGYPDFYRYPGGASQNPSYSGVPITSQDFTNKNR